MGILGDILGIGSSIAGFFGNQNKNKASKEQLALQKMLADKQINLADLISGLSTDFNSKSNEYTDIYGGGTHYNPATGKWESVLGSVPQGLQQASDTEALSRNTYDQAIRRQGMSDANNLRVGAVGEADAARRSYDQQGQGIGVVDPNSVSAQLRLNRTRAVNAGYDDAAKAAGTIGLRTGASAGDTLAQLAKSRASSIAQTYGDPELEGLTTAENINNQRSQAALGKYGLFSGQGSNFIDSGFTPSTAADDATKSMFAVQGLDQNKFGLATGALGSAAAAIGSAANGQRQASDQYFKNYNYNNLSQLIGSIGSQVDGGGSGGLDSILSQLGLGG